VVTELSVSGGAACATSVALSACRAAQKASLQRGEEAPWCAFVDPSATLYGPGVAAAGVQVDRLLIVRPSLDALERTAIRLAESHAFAVLVIDTVGALGKSLSVPLGVWPRIVRRLALGAQESGACVLLTTDAEVPRPLPLPVALRLELSRPSGDRLGVRIAKDRRGRVSAPRTIAWGSPRAKALDITARISSSAPTRASSPKDQGGAELRERSEPPEAAGERSRSEPRGQGPLVSRASA
jgi:recombination protein RecA